MVKRTPAALVALVTALLVAIGVVPALAAPAVAGAGWADWEPLTGSAGDWSTTMRVPASGFPAATVTSSSRGGVGVLSGGSSWLGAATPPGEVYGPSRGRPYLSLRPRADQPAVPSTTTYTFEHPTPAGGWALVLGDIDADRATLTARGADGRLLTGTELGWQGGFNYCAGVGAPSCAGDPQDVPTWDPATGELVGAVGAADTSGAAGWFEPTTPIASLTVEFYQRSGFPVYQTWFAALTRDIAGTVDLVDGTGAPQGVLPGATLTLLGPDGSELDTTTADESGQYIFAGYPAVPGYRVELTALPRPYGAHPSGFVPYGEPAAGDVDLSTADATSVDLPARDIHPVAVSGTVLTDHGTPVAGATVTLVPVGGGTPLSTVTSSQGGYLIDGVGWDAEGDRPRDYTFVLSGLPGGYATVAVPGGRTVEVGQEASSTGNDFVVRAPASLSGTVTAGSEPVPGVVVTLTGSGGAAGTITDAGGGYAFDEVPPGDHTVRVTPPAGYRTDGPDVREAAVGAKDVTDADLTLARLGSIGGTVTDAAGDPVPGVMVMVAGPDGSAVVGTDAAGGYFAGDLAPGDHTITLLIPAGYTAKAVEHSVVVTAAGENRLAEDFDVAAIPVPSPTPSPSATSSASPVPEPSAGPVPSGADGTDAGGSAEPGSLAATGGAVGSVALAAGILVALGVALVRATPRSAAPERQDGR